MKPKYNNSIFRGGLILAVTALLPAVSPVKANIQNTTSITFPSGDYTPVGGSNNTTINATGGTDSTPAVNIGSGITFYGDETSSPAGLSAIVVSGSRYTINNNGNLYGEVGGSGVTSSWALTVNNGSNTNSTAGISTLGGAAIYSSSSLTVNNWGTIWGTTAGIQAYNLSVSPTVTNYASGVITGIGGTNAIPSPGSGIPYSAGIDFSYTDSPTITNWGVITGSNPQIINPTTINNPAILLGTGTSTVLFSGGTINGNIVGGVNFNYTNPTYYGNVNDILHINANTDVELNGAVLYFNNGGNGYGVYRDSSTGNGLAIITGNIVSYPTYNNITYTSGTGTGTGVISNYLSVSSGQLFIQNSVVPNSGNTAAISLTGGELGGISGWSANVNQSGGFLTPGSNPLQASTLLNPSTSAATSIGTLTLASLTTSGTSDLLIHVQPLQTTALGTLIQNSSQLIVSSNGSVTIGGTSTIDLSPTTKNAPLQNGPITAVVHGNGSQTGGYSAAARFYFGSATTGAEAGVADTGLIATSGPGYFTSQTVSLSVLNTATADNVVVSHAYELVPNLSIFGTTFGSYLDTLVAPSATSTNYASLADYLGYLDYSSNAAVVAAMEVFNPARLQYGAEIGLQNARNLHRQIENESLIGTSSETLGTITAWGDADYDFLNTSDLQTLQGTVGIGLNFAPGSSVGIAASTSSTRGSNFDLDTDTDHVGLYGNYSIDNFRFTGFAGWFEASTYYNYGTSFATATGTSRGEGFQALFSGNYDIHSGPATWGPTFGVEYADLRMRNSAIGGLPVRYTVSLGDVESLRSLFGFSSTFETSTPFRPYVSAEWAHEFEKKGITATGSIDSIGNFSAPNLPVNKDTAILRAGVSYKLSSHIGGYFGYLGEVSFNGSGYNSNGIQTAIRGTF